MTARWPKPAATERAASPIACAANSASKGSIWRRRPAALSASVSTPRSIGSTWARHNWRGTPFRSSGQLRTQGGSISVGPKATRSPRWVPPRSSTWAIRMRSSSSPTSLSSMRRAGARRIEIHPMFPQKANVTFAEIDARDRVAARVWERGVGLTLACGSAACATLVAASRLGLMERTGTVRLPGGELVIEWRAADDHVLMTGPVEFEGERVLDGALFEAAL